MKATLGIEDYAAGQLDQLLRVFGKRIKQTAQTPGPDEIHDLRVSMRRLSQAVQLFGSLFPAWEAEEIVKTLKRMMRLTSEVRNRDIALQFLEESKRTRHRVRLRKERLAYQRQFEATILHWSDQDFSAKWRRGLPAGFA
jgi:CHAD domain-containing protein